MLVYHSGFTTITCGERMRDRWCERGHQDREQSQPTADLPLETTLRPEVQVNGQMLEAPRVQADGSWRVRLMEGGGRWTVVHSFEDGFFDEQWRVPSVVSPK